MWIAYWDQQTQRIRSIEIESSVEVKRDWYLKLRKRLGLIWRIDGRRETLEWGC